MAESKKKSQITLATISQFIGFITIVTGLGNYFAKGFKTEYLFFMLAVGVFFLALPLIIKKLK